MQTVILATGIEQFDQGLVHSLEGEDFHILGTVRKKDGLDRLCEQYQPDILIISDLLYGQSQLTGLLIDIKNLLPSVRIIYLTAPTKDKGTLTELSLLAEQGIYDIGREKKYTMEYVLGMVMNPRGPEQVQDLLSGREKKESDITFIFDNAFNPKDIYANKKRAKIVMTSSIKPGSGKSFLSANLAVGIAKYGKDKPKVALIEGDLQNLSIGTLLGLEDSKKNLKSAMERIGSVVRDTGDIEGTAYQLEEVDRYILSCFIPYRQDGINNLYCLVGSQLTFNEVSDISPFYYSYLINAISEEFDVIIIDTNSSISHTTSLPILELSDQAYYVVNLDYNNIRNNVRYMDLLKEIGVDQKVKYILNEAINTNDGQESLMFTQENLEDAGFNVISAIPIIDKSVFYNRLFEGRPIILDKDIAYTQEAKQALLKICNDIYPVESLSSPRPVQQQEGMGSRKNAGKKGLFHGLFS